MKMRMMFCKTCLSKFGIRLKILGKTASFIHGFIALQPMNVSHFSISKKDEVLLVLSDVENGLSK